jgi:hypothetical protein
LAAVARGIVFAQREMDQAALATPESRMALPGGEVRLRPLWFVFAQTTVELELSTFLSGPSRDAPRFECRPLDPVAVALRGYAAASGTRLRIEIAPLGSDLIRGQSKE